MQKKKLFLISAVLSMISLSGILSVVQPVNTWAWKDNATNFGSPVNAWTWKDNATNFGSVGVHGLLTREAISLLRSRRYDGIAGVAEYYLYDLIKGNSDEDRDGGPIIPGQDYNAIWHWLDPMDHNEFILTRATSAADRAVMKFKEAVKSWKDGNYKYAFDRLGHALHLVQDLLVPICHTMPHHAIRDMDQHDLFEKIAEGVMNDIFYRWVEKPNYDPVYSWELAREKTKYWTGDDFSEADNENGHITGHHPVWGFADAGAHYSWTWLPYLFDHRIELDDHAGDTTDYFWTRDLKKGDDGTLILHFRGADKIVIDFDEIDMTNALFDRLGWVEVYDKYNRLVYKEDRDFFAPDVTVMGDTAKIRAYVNEGSFWDSDVDGYEVDELYVYDSIQTKGNSPMSKYSMERYTNMQYAAYHLLKKAVELSAGVIKYFFDNLVRRQRVEVHCEAIKVGDDSGWLRHVATPDNAMAMVVTAKSLSSYYGNPDLRVGSYGSSTVTGGRMSNDNKIYEDIPNSEYSGIYSNPERVTVINPWSIYACNIYNYKGSETRYYAFYVFLVNKYPSNSGSGSSGGGGGGGGGGGPINMQ